KLLADSGRLLPTDPVCKQGKSRWVPAREVKGLFDGGVLSEGLGEWGKAALIIGGEGVVVVVALAISTLPHSPFSRATPPPAAPGGSPCRERAGLSPHSTAQTHPRSPAGNARGANGVEWRPTRFWRPSRKSLARPRRSDRTNRQGPPHSWRRYQDRGPRPRCL